DPHPGDIDVMDTSEPRMHEPLLADAVMWNQLNQNQSGTSNNFAVIAILGIVGVGKSTLARLVYNDTETKEHFDLKVLVSIKLEDFSYTSSNQSSL
ncbi:putative NBS-LRR resistance protein, partial [Trifolium pratense]